MSLTIYRLIRRIHKWASIGFSVFLIIWLITGIVYVLPVSVLGKIDRLITVEKKVESSEVEVNSININFISSKTSFKDIKVSIPEAISILETEIGHALQVAGCSVYKTSDKLVYEIALKNEEKYLVDAIVGKLVKLTNADVKNIALAAAPLGSNIVDVAFLRERPYAYWGPIPTYRFIYNDMARTHVYISPTTGQIEFKNEGWNRLKEWMVSLHKFEFLNLLLMGDKFRKGVLLILSLIGLAVVMTGVYLALPAKIRRPKRLFERKI
jgi:hypothetical protein